MANPASGCSVRNLQPVDVLISQLFRAVVTIAFLLSIKSGFVIVRGKHCRASRHDARLNYQLATVVFENVDRQNATGDCLSNPNSPSPRSASRQELVIEKKNTALANLLFQHTRRRTMNSGNRVELVRLLSVEAKFGLILRQILVTPAAPHVMQ